MSDQLNEYELNKAFYSPSIYNENLLEGVAHSYRKQQIENHARYCKTRPFQFALQLRQILALSIMMKNDDFEGVL